MLQQIALFDRSKLVFLIIYVELGLCTCTKQYATLEITKIILSLLAYAPVSCI